MPKKNRYPEWSVGSRLIFTNFKRFDPHWLHRTIKTYKKTKSYLDADTTRDSLIAMTRLVPASKFNVNAMRQLAIEALLLQQMSLTTC